MKPLFIKLGYEITTDTGFLNKKYGISPALESQFEKLIQEATQGTSKIVGKLDKLIIQYPSIPQLKNFLSVAYAARGNNEKAIEVNNQIRAEHPDYLFAKLNAANIHIDNEEYDKVPELLGDLLEIKDLYPDRDLFHLAEVTGYLKAVIRYFAAIDNFDLAENRLEILLKIAPDHPDTEQAQLFILSEALKRSTERMEAEERARITPKPHKIVPILKNSTPPKFHHPEIDYLYQNNMRISHDNLREILALPRATLIEDLENVIQDGIDRYGYYKQSENEDEYECQVLHAFFLLSELKAEESLPKLLAFLEYDPEFLDYWISDHQTETLWQCIYTLGMSNLPLLQQFLLKPGVDTYSKSCVTSALAQMVLHHPDKRDEVLHTFSEVLIRYANAAPEDDLIDSDFIALAICDAMDCNLRELKPIIKLLYENEYVSLGISGDYDEVSKAYTDRQMALFKKDTQNIFELYEDVITTWAGYDDDEDDDDEDDDIPYFYNPPPKPVIVEKIGRNTPCPCGSGKKYKKCCG